MTKKNDDYEVGYGKPPKHTRWAKGTSGNPSGKRKRELSMAECIDLELTQKINIAINGKKSRISLRQAISKTIVKEALQGDTAARKLLLQLDPLKPPPIAEIEEIHCFTLNLEEDDQRPHTWVKPKQGPATH